MAQDHLTLENKTATNTPAIMKGPASQASIIEKGKFYHERILKYITHRVTSYLLMFLLVRTLENCHHRLAFRLHHGPTYP